VTRWRGPAIVVLALGVLVVAGCGGDERGAGRTTATAAHTFPAGTTMARLQDAGEMTIGVKFDLPPFGFENPTSGGVEGFDVDVATAVADALGVQPKFVEALADDGVGLLEGGTADLVLATLTISAAGDRRIDFSEPYFIAHGRILVKSADTSITAVGDLVRKRVCTVRGSTYQHALKRKAPRARRRLVDSYATCLKLLQGGAADAISADDATLTGMIIEDPSLKLVGEPLTTEAYGAGVKDGDAAFQTFVNGVLATFKADGRWDAAYERWIGRYTGEPQKPPAMTLQEALGRSS
jgi:ABC-type amino acid transport substrate-binding protein